MAIRELKHEYCYATDDLDVDRIVAAFTEDGGLIVPIHDPIRGHDSLADYFEWFAQQEYEIKAHNVFNPIIDVDGDTATGKMVLHGTVYTPRRERQGGARPLRQRVRPDRRRVENIVCDCPPSHHEGDFRESDRVI